MKTTHYSNRYGDTIQFKEVSKNKVEMSGYDPEWLRVGWSNDYSDAYDIYLNQCKMLEEPDYYYLVDDPNTNKCRPMTYQEFAHRVENNEDYRPYLRYTESDKSRYEMVDPSGGPYISLGMNIGRYFEDGVTRIVDEIQFDNNKIIFTVSNK